MSGWAIARGKARKVTRNESYERELSLLWRTLCCVNRTQRCSGESTENYSDCCSPSPFFHLLLKKLEHGNLPPLDLSFSICKMRIVKETAAE
jgi:hypothetical protein